MDKIYLLDGGIGDFLQCIPFINAGKHNNVKYGVITHLLNASIIRNIPQNIDDCFFITLILSDHTDKSYNYHYMNRR